MKVELYHTTSELKKLFRKEQNPRLATRIRAVYLALMDKSAVQIGELLGYSRRTKYLGTPYIFIFAFSVPS